MKLAGSAFGALPPRVFALGVGRLRELHDDATIIKCSRMQPRRRWNARPSV